MPAAGCRGRGSVFEKKVAVLGLVEEALAGADAIVLVTEWAQFRDLDPDWARTLVGTPLIVDGRNTLDAERWRSAGWTYRGFGRP